MGEVTEVTDWYDRICGRQRFIVTADPLADPADLAEDEISVTIRGRTPYLWVPEAHAVAN
jgi:hypothetical protein